LKGHNINDHNKHLEVESSARVGHFINNIKQVITESHTAQEKFNFQYHQALAASSVFIGNHKYD
jgi:hypothetical protein